MSRLMELRRERIAKAVERLLAVLDAMDGDLDPEPEEDRCPADDPDPAAGGDNRPGDPDDAEPDDDREDSDQPPIMGQHLVPHLGKPLDSNGVN